MNCRAVPAAADGFAGVTAIDTSVGLATVYVAVAEAAKVVLAALVAMAVTLLRPLVAPAGEVTFNVVEPAEPGARVSVGAV